MGLGVVCVGSGWGRGVDGSAGADEGSFAGCPKNVGLLLLGGQPGEAGMLGGSAVEAQFNGVSQECGRGQESLVGFGVDYVSQRFAGQQSAKAKCGRLTEFPASYFCSFFPAYCFFRPVYSSRFSELRSAH